MNDELISKPASNLVESPTKAIGGTLSDVWQAIVGDPVTAWRIKRAARLNEPVKKALAEVGVELRVDSLPEGMAFRWFQKATEADEPEIQELFARLLANAANGNSDAQAKRNIDLVSNLTPDDAKFLDFVHTRYVEFRGSRRAKYEAFAIVYDWSFEREFKASGFTSHLPMDSLLSMGILRLERNFKSSGSDIGRVISLAMSDHVRGSDIGIDHMFEEEEKLVLTEVGKSLLQALFPSFAETTDEEVT